MKKGFTLIEFVITIAIISIIATIAILNYKRWVKKISIENDTKKIFALLNEARVRAFSEKRVCGVVFDFNKRDVRLVCDTDMDNSILDETTNLNEIILKNDFSPKNKNFTYAKFDKDGTASILATIYAKDISTNPAYSCVKISYTRIKMGKWDGSDCILK